MSMDSDSNVQTATEPSSITITHRLKDYLDSTGRTVITKDEAGRFICCICEKRFHKKIQCFRHLSITHEIKVNEIRRAHLYVSNNCPNCNKKFNQRSNLFRHIRIAHGGKGLPNAMRHPARIEATKEINCPMCSQSFSSISSVNRHIRQYHSHELEEDAEAQSSDVLSCHFCPLKFSADRLKVHMSNYHFIIYSSNLNDDELLIEQYQCSLCATHFFTQSEIKTHLLEEHGKDVSEFEIEVASESENQKESDEPFNCDGCQVNYEDERMWRSHMKEVHDAFPESSCHKCGDHSFKTVHALKCHLRDVHAVFTTEAPPKRILKKIRANDLGLSVGEFRALEKVPDWLVKHGDGQLLVVVQRTS